MKHQPPPLPPPRPQSARNRRIEAFVQFCIDHQVAVSLIMWLLIAIGGVALWRMS